MTWRGHLADTRHWAEGAGMGTGMGTEMGTCFLHCSPPIPFPAMHPLCPSLHPAYSSISQGSASTWILVLEAQKALGQSSPGTPGTPKAPAATPRCPVPGGHSGCTGTTPGLSPHHSTSRSHRSAGGTEQLLC